MKSGIQVALAIGAGYLLGRRKKRLAIIMFGAAAMAGGSGGGVTGRLLGKGTELLGSSDVLSKISPQVGEITDLIRGDLADAAKTAAMAAVTSRIDSLSDSLRDRADALRQPGGKVQEKTGRGARPEDEDAGQEAGEQLIDEPGAVAERPVSARATRREARRDTDEPEPDDVDEAEPDDVDEAEPDEVDEAEPDDVDEQEPPAPRRRPAQSVSAGASTPVRRTRR